MVRRRPRRARRHSGRRRRHPLRRARAGCPELQPIYAGYYIWRGAPNEADLAPQTLREIFLYFTFYLPERQQVITYPISGFNNDLRPGHRRYNFIWYRVADAREMKDMCVDERGVRHEYSVPPPLIRKDLIARMYDDAREIRPPVLLDCVLTAARPAGGLQGSPAWEVAPSGAGWSLAGCWKAPEGGLA